MGLSIKKLLRRLKKYKNWLICGVIGGLCYIYYKKSGIMNVPLSNFMGLLAQNRINEVVINGSFLRFKEQNISKWQLTNRSLMEDSHLLKSLQQSKVEYSSSIIDDRTLLHLLGIAIPCLLVYTAFSFIRGPSSNFKSPQQKTKEGPYFTEIGGLEEPKRILRQVIFTLKEHKKCEAIGIRGTRGVLLYGPPGTGKTYIARAMANECKVSFIYANGSEFVELYVGVGAKRIRDLFKEARERKPCIIFLDEIDALGAARSIGNTTGGQKETDITLNQLLSEMDGFLNYQGVTVIAATNNEQAIDKALLRPGRFDHKIFVGLPNQLDRIQIFKIHLYNKPTNVSSQFMEKLGLFTNGLSGAEIEHIVNNATFSALTEGYISEEALYEAARIYIQSKSNFDKGKLKIFQAAIDSKY